MFSKLAFGAAAVMTGIEAADTAAWKSRAVYQILTDRFARDDTANAAACSNLSGYCGGTWKGIQNHLDYVQGLGFDAIWITPVVDNLDGGYHGYWARNWEKLNSHFGSEDDLKNLVKTAHSKGIWVMVDVVANHVAPVGDDFSQIYPFNKAEHYHSDCQIQDWSNQAQVENCRLADLPDLNQDNQYVRDYLKNWVKNLVQTYDFDGIRIDTIPEVHNTFWKEFGDAAGVFQMGENFNGDSNYVGPYQNYVTGLFNYPMYFTIKDVWGSGKSMYGIKNRFAEESSKFKDLDALGLFVDNHDNARFLNQFQDTTMFKGALTFALTGRGIPFYYYGSEQAYAGGNDPNNRESLWQDMNTDSDIYKMTAAINKARKTMKSYDHPVEERYVQDNFYCFQRGKFLVAVTNSHNDQTITVPNTAFDNGEQVCNIFYPTTDCQTVQDKSVKVFLKNGESKIYVPKASLVDDTFIAIQ